MYLLYLEKITKSKRAEKNGNRNEWTGFGKLNVRATTKTGHSLENSAAHWKDVFANNTGTTFLALLAPLLKQTTANPFGTM